MKNPFKRRPQEPLDMSLPVDDTAARQIAALVNAGRGDEAARLADSTSNPRGNAFAAFRYIDLEEG